MSIFEVENYVEPRNDGGVLLAGPALHEAGKAIRSFSEYYRYGEEIIKLSSNQDLYVPFDTKGCELVVDSLEAAKANDYALDRAAQAYRSEIMAKMHRYSAYKRERQTREYYASMAMSEMAIKRAQLRHSLGNYIVSLSFSKEEQAV